MRAGDWLVCTVVGLLISLPASVAYAGASPAETRRGELADRLGLSKKKSQAQREREGEQDETPEDPEPEPPEDIDDEATPDDSDAARPDPPPGGEAQPPAKRAPTYTRRIHKILQASCGTCHKAGGSAAGTKLVFDGDPAHDYARAKAFVRTGDPDGSALLTKAAGKSHLGGAPLAAGKSGHSAIREWIAAGAPYGGRAAPKAAPVVTPAPVASPPAATARPAAPRKAAPRPAEAAPAPEPTPEPPTDAPAPAADRITFAPEVHDLLLAKCKGCHSPGAIAGHGAFSLSGDPGTDHATVVSLIDWDRHADSRLLSKAAGREHAGGASMPVESTEYATVLAWIDDGAVGPGAAEQPAATVDPGELDAVTSASGTATGSRLGNGTPNPPRATASPLPLRLPFGLRINGKLDFSYERRAWKDHPFQGGRNAFQTYHHFVFLSRSSNEDPFGFDVELLTQAFFEFNARIAPKRRRFDFLFKAGKIMVPFGNEPLFHKSYGGRSGFDQEILPVIWAQPGVAMTTNLRAGPLSFANDIYTVQGLALRSPDATLNLQNDVSSIDEFRAAFGDRIGASWQPLTAWYSLQANYLGHGRMLFMQAVDLEMWRPQDVPLLRNLVLGIGGMRADVSGAGPGDDYYHFGSYATVGYFPIQPLYLQYRAGLRTTDNRRGVYFDDTRMDERDRSSHNLSVTGRYKGFYAGFQVFWNLEKANEQDDDFLRLTVGYEF